MLKICLLCPCQSINIETYTYLNCLLSLKGYFLNQVEEKKKLFCSFLQNKYLNLTSPSSSTRKSVTALRLRDPDPPGLSVSLSLLLPSSIIRRI